MSSYQHFINHFSNIPLNNRRRINVVHLHPIHQSSILNNVAVVVSNIYPLDVCFHELNGWIITLDFDDSCDTNYLNIEYHGQDEIEHACFIPSLVNTLIDRITDEIYRGHIRYDNMINVLLHPHNYDVLAQELYNENLVHNVGGEIGNGYISLVTPMGYFRVMSDIHVGLGEAWMHSEPNPPDGRCYPHMQFLLNEPRPRTCYTGASVSAQLRQDQESLAGFIYYDTPPEIAHMEQAMRDAIIYGIGGLPKETPLDNFKMDDVLLRLEKIGG